MLDTIAINDWNANLVACSQESGMVTMAEGKFPLWMYFRIDWFNFSAFILMTNFNENGSTSDPFGFFCA